MRLIACSSLFVLAFSLTARAEIKYEYVAEPADVKVEPGKTVPVKVYLQETLTGDSKSLLGTGLFASGFKMTRKSGDATVEFKRNPAFGGPGNPIAITADKADGGLLLGVAFKAPGVKAVPRDKKGPKGVNKVWIATAEITGGKESESVFELDSYTSQGTLTNVDLFNLDQSQKKGAKTAQTPPSTVPEDYVGAGVGSRPTITIRKAEKSKK